MYKPVNFFKITLSISLWTVFLCTYLVSCKVAPMYLRNNQVKNADKKDGIVRVYMDKRGALYPSVNVAMDSDLFKHRRLLRSVLKDPDASSLSWYFTSDPQRLAALRQAYHVSAGNSPIRDFQAVQDRILA